MNVEQNKRMEKKKYQIEVNHIKNVWKKESYESDYFEEKFGKYLDDDYRLNEEDRIEKEYIEMYELDDLYEEEGDR